MYSNPLIAETVTIFITHKEEYFSRSWLWHFYYSTNNVAHFPLCSAGSRPQQMPQRCGLESRPEGLTFIDAFTCSRARRRPELLGGLLIPICQRLTSCPERAVKTVFSQQPSGELGILPWLGLTHTVEFHITAGKTWRKFREQDKELEAALLLNYTFLRDQ